MAISSITGIVIKIIRCLILKVCKRADSYYVFKKITKIKRNIKIVYVRG